MKKKKVNAVIVINESDWLRLNNRVLNVLVVLKYTAWDTYLFLRQRRVQNLVRQLRWNIVEEWLYRWTNFVKSSILDIWQSTKSNSGPIYAKFWIWQIPKYGRGLNVRAQHSAIWQGSEYARVTQGSKYAIIWLSMSK